MMAAYTGGDAIGAIVADVGHYSTKMGYAGEDYPRSLFRSEVAVLKTTGTNKDSSNNSSRKEGKSESNNKTDTKQTKTSVGEEGGHRGKKRRGNQNIESIRYDYFTRPLCREDSDDGDWEVMNPIDPITGLLYTPPSENDSLSAAAAAATATASGAGSSLNSNNDNQKSNEPTASTINKNDNTDASSSSYDYYELLEKFITHGYESALCVKPSDHPFMLVEKSYNIPPLRQQLMELLFETIHVPATFLARDATMACYATGRTTGTVVDVGSLSTVVTPVYEGYVEARGIMRSPVGGLSMDSMVLQTLDRLYKKKVQDVGIGIGGGGGATKGGKRIEYAMPLYQTRMKDFQRRKDSIHKLARLDMARQCKEEWVGAGVAAMGYVTSRDNSMEMVGSTTVGATAAAGGGGGGGAPNAAYANAPKIPYKLPDGTVVDVPQTDRYDVAELLFGRDEFTTRRREDGASDWKKRLGSVLATTASLTSPGEEEDGIMDDPTISASGLLKKNRVVGGSAGKTRQGPKRSSHHALNRACYMYLQSQIGEITSSPIPTMVCDAAFKCDRDQQAQLLGNVVLAGGGACIPPDNAFPDRLRDEVEGIIHTHTPGWRVKVLSPSIQERAVCSWLGGSILASLGTFHDMWITKAEYDEWGGGIVNRKCP